MLSKREKNLAGLFLVLLILLGGYRFILRPAWIALQDLIQENHSLANQIQTYQAMPLNSPAPDVVESLLVLPSVLATDTIIITLDELSRQNATTLQKLHLIQYAAEDHGKLQYGSYSFTCSGELAAVVDFLTEFESGMNGWFTLERMKWYGFQGRVEIYGEFRAYFDPSGGYAG